MRLHKICVAAIAGMAVIAFTGSASARGHGGGRSGGFHSMNGFRGGGVRGAGFRGVRGWGGGGVYAHRGWYGHGWNNHGWYGHYGYGGLRVVLGGWPYWGYPYYYPPYYPYGYYPYGYNAYYGGGYATAYAPQHHYVRHDDGVYQGQAAPHDVEK